MNHLSGCAIAVLTMATAVQVSGAIPFGGNLLVSTNDTIYEISRSGHVVQNIPIPYPGDNRPSGESARDLVSMPDGTVLVYNGTSETYLSSLGAGGGWSHLLVPGVNAGGNISYGGIAATASYAFLTDVGGSSETVEGVVRINRGNGVSEQFATDLEPIDLTLGFDGLLYVLEPGGSPSGLRIYVFHPETLDLVRSLNLGDIFGHTEHRAIAVNAAGEIFIADWDSDVQKIGPDGTLLASINLGSLDVHDLHDIDVSGNGAVVIGDRFGKVVLTDEFFSSVTVIEAGPGDSTFVAFVDPESPGDPGNPGDPGDPGNPGDPGYTGVLGARISKAQKIRINGTGAHQILIYSPARVKKWVTPYATAPETLFYLLPHESWLGLFLYDYDTGGFSQALYQWRN